MMRKEIYYSGFTFILNSPYGIDLKISKLGFLTTGVPDVFYTRITGSECEYKHKEFEYDIFKTPTPALKIAEEQKRKSKDDFLMKPFEYGEKWSALETDNLVYCHNYSFVDDIKKKHKTPRIFHKFLLLSALIIAFSLWLYVFFGFFMITLFLFFVREMAHYDNRRVISVIFYDMDNVSETLYNRLKSAFLKKNKIDLISNAERKGKNKVTRETVKVYDKGDDLIKTNIDPFMIQTDNGYIVFFPDKLIIFYKNGEITGYDFRNLNIVGGKVKLKNGEISSYLSFKNRDGFHLLFYIENNDTAQTIIESLTTLQREKKRQE